MHDASCITGVNESRVFYRKPAGLCWDFYVSPQQSWGQYEDQVLLGFIKTIANPHSEEKKAIKNPRVSL